MAYPPPKTKADFEEEMRKFEAEISVASATTSSGPSARLLPPQNNYQPICQFNMQQRMPPYQSVPSTHHQIYPQSPVQQTGLKPQTYTSYSKFPHLNPNPELAKAAYAQGKTLVTANKAMFEAQKARLWQQKETRVIGPSTTPKTAAQIEKSNKKTKNIKYLRAAGGEVWQDETLQEWDPDDFRIFCGDLGNEVTDELLARTFRIYPSFQKAKIVREKASNKSKGYGFVSFKDMNDYIRAMKEMNGKYVGNRPIKLRKSTWKERQLPSVLKKYKEKRKLGLR